MVEVNWAVDDPPHPVSRRHEGRSDVQQAELPEVLALAEEGWCLAPDAPMWVFLPAVWPVSERTWVPDRSTNYVTRWSDSGYSDRVPWSDHDYTEVEADMNMLLGQAGVPGRPAGRLWLLRVPAQFKDLDDVLDDLVSSADAQSVVPNCNRDFVVHVAHRLQPLFDEPGGRG